MAGLSVSRLVNINVDLSPTAAVNRTFGTLMIAGDSNVIGGLERFRNYSDITGVANDFGVSAPEYLAAQLYFEQVPQPASLQVGRWLRTATSGQNIGGILTAAQQSLSNWNIISSGGLDIVIDGVAKNLTGLNFTGVTNLNGVASVITTGLTGAGTCLWNGQQFIISSNTTGPGYSAAGSIPFSGNPANLDTVTVNGVVIEFVSGTPTGNEVLIGSSEAATLANLQTFLQNSTNALIDVATYSMAYPAINISYNATGVGGNAFTLAKSSTAIAISGATLTGGQVPSSVGYATPGAGSDISGQLMLNAALSLSLASGYAAESPVQCEAALAALSTAWYGFMFAASVMPTDSQSLAVSSDIEAQPVSRIYGVTTQETAVLSNLSTTDLPSLMMAAGYLRSFPQYSSSSPYAVASAFGRSFSVDFTQSLSTITLMYKNEPGVTAESLTSAQADTLLAKRCNVFASYVNGTLIYQYGTMSGPAWFDEIQNTDWFQNDMQTDLYNLLYTSPTKVPQTDAGTTQCVNTIGQACADAVNNGMAAPGVWNGPSFGSLVTGQYLKQGFYIYCQPIALQSQSDREARKAPPIQVAIKLAGAIQTIDATILVNR